jgi:CxxC motif-containing protein (DUF1111 family)
MTIRLKAAFKDFGGIVAAALALCACTASQPTPAPVDPGVRGGAAGAGTPLPGLTADETAFFQDGLARFEEIETVTGSNNNGLGPRFNSIQCLSCHSQPVAGGSSPARNPLIGIATLNGAKNKVPWFITPNGPVREARFQWSPDGTNDGEVHDLFVINGRSDAAGCDIVQPDFLPAGDPLSGRGGNPNIIFRIPTPVFGAGLIEAISDAALLANLKADASLKKDLGISGHANAHLSGNVKRSANDGTITRFGWKAQNKPLLMFAAEAYNVEMGITNQLFPQERDETPGCLFTATPNDTLNFTTTPTATANPSTAVLSDIHHMGTGLADGITQGGAGPDEFRTAPLWGVGQRIFFLHDGRTSNLVEAIEFHRSPGSEASKVIDRFDQLSTPEKRDIINFLRSL